MSKFGIVALVAVALAAGCPLFGDSVAIGQLQLGQNNGYQTISFFNNTGASAGCASSGPQYVVCTSVDITAWTLTLTFTNENPGGSGASYDNTLSSPVVFASGLNDTIGPFDGSDPYSAGSEGTWELPLNFGNSDEPACGPTCDYQITEVDFSGTIDSSDLPMRLYNGQTYNGSDPSTYTVFNALSTFSASWVISPADYATLADPAFLTDQADVLVTDQAPPPPAPEPATGALLAVGWLGFLLVHRSRRRQSN